MRRTVKIRSTLVRRRVTCTQWLDALLEILGPGWTCALGTVMTATVLLFLSRWSDPHQVLSVELLAELFVIFPQGLHLADNLTDTR